MEDIFVNNIFHLYKEKQWKTIINNFSNVENRAKLLWVFPSEENIEFISDVLKKYEKKSIVSIGCGSGLLEWIMKESLGINVTGVEVDGAWWDCKYAPPAFIPLHLAKIKLEEDQRTQEILDDKKMALLFCYFNNGPAFEKYIEYYKGDTILIIGPGEGRHTHTNPSPFAPNLDSKWRLYASQEVRNTKDFIAIYRR